jgi:ribosomal protein L5
LTKNVAFILVIVIGGFPLSKFTFRGVAMFKIRKGHKIGSMVYDTQAYHS